MVGSRRYNYIAFNNGDTATEAEDWKASGRLQQVMMRVGFVE
jgi:hypothetical protein